MLIYNKKRRNGLALVIADFSKIKLPRIIYNCCGNTYDSKNITTVGCFRAFVHESKIKTITDYSGKPQNISFCITQWLVCKQNNCVTSFTYFYNDKNHEIMNIKAKGIKYLLRIKDKFISNISLQVKTLKIPEKNKKYLWYYTDVNKNNPLKRNIYDFNNNKVGEVL